MPKAEGLTLEMKDKTAIRRDLLESFPYTGNSQLIEYTTEEFSAVCPFSGLPDLATVVVRYVPEGKIVELKSLKYYWISYRLVGIYQEDATHEIYEDLKKLLSPKFLEVKTIYKTRGGIDAVCIMNSEEIAKESEKKKR